MVRLAVLTAKGGATGANGWPAAERLATNATATAGEAPLCRGLPDDPGVTAGTLSALADGVDADAVVSLCRIGRGGPPAGHRLLPRARAEPRRVAATCAEDAVCEPGSPREAL